MIMASNLMLRSIQGFDDWLKSEYESGKTMGKIAILCGCSRPAITHHLKRLGVEIKHNGYYKQHKTISDSGYVKIYIPAHPASTKSGYVPEHRLIMEEKIGRYLSKKEVVHHINGIKTDNRIENLYLYKSESEHMAYHMKKQSIVIIDKQNNKIEFSGMGKASKYLSRGYGYISNNLKLGRKITDNNGLEYNVIMGDM